MTGDRLRAVGGLAALGVIASVLAASWLGSSGVTQAAATVGGHASGSAATTPVTAADQAAVVEAGRGLFVANCASCHGPQGQGGAAGPSLVGVGAASADFYLRTGRMPLSAPGQRAVRADPHFDEAGIEALVAYVASLGQGPEVPQVAGGGDIHKGWALFQANCAACHNATGAGNAIGGGFVAVGLGQADPKTVAEATIIGPGAMPAFKFDQASLADLAAYVRFLRDAPTPGGAAIGQTGPVAEGFIGVAIGLPLLLLVSFFVARHGRRAVARPTDEASADRPGTIVADRPVRPADATGRTGAANDVRARNDDTGSASP
jgi:ubiquinol-cytochrome c reductase cytochrome c subunit